MKHGRALNMNRSSYLRARALADRVITETLKRDPDRVVRAITFVVEKLPPRLERVAGGQWRPVRQRDQFNPHGSERQRTGGRLRGERLRPGRAKWLGQPGIAEERCSGHRVRQAVGGFGIGELVGIVAGVLGSLDRAPRVTAQAN